MSERRKIGVKKNRAIAYTAAGLVHALIIGAMVFNFTSKHDSIDAVYADKVEKIVQATTIDESLIKQQQKKLKDADDAKKKRERLDRERLEKLKKDAAKEEQAIEDLKKKQEVEKEKTAELEKERKAIALKKQQELEKEKQAAEKRKREAKERDRKEKLAAKKKQQRLEQQERERLEAEEKEFLASQEMNRMLAEEEAMVAASQRATTLRAKYAALIQDKVRRYRTISPDFERWRTTTVNVKLSSSGEVQSVRTIKSSGNVRYDRSVETAIYQASPLPIPSVAEDSEVNKVFRDLNLNFDMTGM